MSVDTTVLDEISRYDDVYQPAERIQQRPGLDTLPDGDYEFTILSADLGRTAKQNAPILRVEIRVDGGPPGTPGSVVERAYFFDSPEKVGYLGADLITLGFDADQWVASAGRPFSRELAAAVPRLAGIRFAGKKVTAKQSSGTYHNLYINRRLGGSTGGPAALSAPAPATVDSDDVPF